MEGAFLIPADPKARLDLFDKARKEALKEGITLTGDTKTGAFSGSTLLGNVAGTYRTDDDFVYVNVTKKPIIVPWLILRKVLEGFFSWNKP